MHDRYRGDPFFAKRQVNHGTGNKAQADGNGHGKKAREAEYSEESLT